MVSHGGDRPELRTLRTPGPISHKENVVVDQEVEGEWRKGGVLWSTIVAVYACQTCEEPTVWTYDWTDEMELALGERRLYPTARDNSAVPAKVQQRLDSALKVKKLDPAFYAVGVRRMLETVCNEEGASGKDLFAKLDDLAGKGRIPDTLAQVAHQLREFGNLGAHDAEVEVEFAEVPVIEDFADAILEYLYRAPAKLSAVQGGVAQRRQAN